MTLRTSLWSVRRMVGSRQGVCILVLRLVVLGCLVEAVAALWSEWCPKVCSCYNMFTTVDCSSRRVAAVPVLPNTTTHLYLENNRIEHLFPMSFSRVPNLLVLNLHDNQLTVIDTAAFAGLQHLQDLNLSLNELIVLRASLAPNSSLPNLHDLDLSRNQLQNIPRNLANFTPHLHMLNLAYNQIKSVWLDRSYANMTMLHHLDLTGNPIHVLGTFHLDALRNGPLEVLRMANCLLVHIDAKAFQGMNNLTSLSLSSNTGVSLSVLIMALNGFTNESALEFLDLSSMHLGNLSAGLFASFPRLQILDLSNNSLFSVDANIFRTVPHLHTLDIQENHLTTLNTSNWLRYLQRLNLRKNWIRNIVVDDLVSIEFLDLSQNRLEEVPSHWITHSDSLKFLNLGHNRIRRANQHSFQKVTLSYLDLSFNRLTSFHSLGMVKIGTLILAHNRIKTICRNAFDHLEATLEQLDMSYNHLTHLPNHTYPIFTALQRLNLAHNALGLWLKTPPQVNLFISFSHLQVFDLSNNNITTLPNMVLDHLHHLTTLHLDGNNICDLGQVALSGMLSLAKLDLSNNSLKEVDTSILVGLQYLEQVDLSYNPFLCTCHLVSFLQWINSTQVTIVDLHDHEHYSCTHPRTHLGMHVTEYRPSKADCDGHHHDIAWDLTIFGITVAAVIGVTIVTALVLYYGKVCHKLKSLHYRWQIRYREVSGMELPDPKV